MKLYLAGPMTGYPEHNFPLFHSEALRLRRLGYLVVNPAEMNVDTKFDWQVCMIADIKAAVDCDGIALLPNWYRSKGASLEYHVMKELGKKVYEAEVLMMFSSSLEALEARQL